MKTVEKKRRLGASARLRSFLQRQRNDALAEEEPSFLSPQHSARANMSAGQQSVEIDTLQRQPETINIPASTKNRHKLIPLISNLLIKDQAKEKPEAILAEIVNYVQDATTGGTAYNLDLLASFIRQGRVEDLSRLYFAADALRRVTEKQELVKVFYPVNSVITGIPLAKTAAFSIRRTWLDLCLSNPAVRQHPLDQLILDTFIFFRVLYSDNIARMYFNRLFRERSYSRIPDDVMDKATQRSAGTGIYGSVRCVPASLIAAINATYGISGLLSAMETVFDRLIQENNPVSDQLARIYNKFFVFSFSPGDVQLLQEILYLQMGNLDDVGTTKSMNLLRFYYQIETDLAKLKGQASPYFDFSPIPEEARIISIKFTYHREIKGHAITIFYNRFKGFVVYESWGFAPGFRRTLRRYKDAGSFEEVMDKMKSYYESLGYKNVQLSPELTVSSLRASSAGQQKGLPWNNASAQ